MDVSLTVETGRVTGTSASRRLRGEGLVPGVVYGMGKDAVAVSVAWTDLRAVLTTEAGLNALIDLDVDGHSDLAIIKELQRDPVRRDVTHVDFLLIDRDVDIEVEVPVVLTGEAVELTQEGGLVDQLLYRLTIKARPGSIPNELTADITDITIEAGIKVADIALPDGVTTEVELDEPVATAFIPRAIEDEEAEAAAAAALEALEGLDGEALEGLEALEGVEGDAGEGSDGESADADADAGD